MFMVIYIFKDKIRAQKIASLVCYIVLYCDVLYCVLHCDGGKRCIEKKRKYKNINNYTWVWYCNVFTSPCCPLFFFSKYWV